VRAAQGEQRTYRAVATVRACPALAPEQPIMPEVRLFALARAYVVSADYRLQIGVAPGVWRTRLAATHPGVLLVEVSDVITADAAD